MCNIGVYVCLQCVALFTLGEKKVLSADDSYKNFYKNCYKNNYYSYPFIFMILSLR